MKPRQKYSTLLNNFEWFAKRHHNRLMRHLRDEQKRLEYALRVALKAAGVSILMLSAAFAQPPLPQAQVQQDMGKQVPYVMTTTAYMTQTVVTVYSLKCLRVIDREGDKLDTNYTVLKTNGFISVTNTTPLAPML